MGGAGDRSSGTVFVPLPFEDDPSPTSMKLDFNEDVDKFWKDRNSDISGTWII